MMKKRSSAAVLVALALLTAACGSDEAPERTEAAQGATVPDVVHQELRAGVQRLVSAGYRVVLASDIGSEEYVDSLNEYVDAGKMTMTPEPFIGATDPAPGSPADEGTTVTVTRIECPDRADSCD